MRKLVVKTFVIDKFDGFSIKWNLYKSSLTHKPKIINNEEWLGNCVEESYLKLRSDISYKDNVISRLVKIVHKVVDFALWYTQKYPVNAAIAVGKTYRFTELSTGQQLFVVYCYCLLLLSNNNTTKTLLFTWSFAQNKQNLQQIKTHC